MSALVMLALTLSIASSDQTRVTPPSSRLTVTVTVQDYASVPSDWLRQATNEMARIYHEIGVEIVWWDPPQSSSQSAPQDLLIVIIRATSESSERNYPANAMGAASGTANDRGRVAYIFYNRTAQFTPLYRGRFLGHFMAHEVGHLLLPQYSHSPTGLMRAQWSRDDLERAQYGRLGFTSEQATLIRSKVAKVAGPTPNPQ